MRKFKSSISWILAAVILSYSGTVLAGSESTISASLPKNDESTSSLQFKPAIDLLVGTSSNVGKLQNATAGSYGKASPSIGVEYAPSETVVLTSQLSADLKQYSAQDTQAIGNESRAELRNLGIWFLSEKWEVGGDLGASYSDSLLPVQVSSTQTTAEQQKYLEPDSRVYGAWTGEKLAAETGISVKSRSYSTLLEDRGNSYHNDFNQFAGDIKFGYNLSKTSKISIKGLVEDRKYKERPADFTDGAASNPASPLPILEENAAELSAVAETTIGKVKLTSTPAIRFNKDKVFGARDSQTLKFQQKAIIPFSDRFSWTPTFSISQESFTRFRSSPEVDPFGSPLRRDLNLKASSPFKYRVSKFVQVLAEYSFSRLDSNYADSSYSEHAVSMGLGISM